MGASVWVNDGLKKSNMYGLKRWLLGKAVVSVRRCVEGESLVNIVLACMCECVGGCYVIKN